MPNDLFAAPVTTIAELARQEAECRRCSLYRDATQVVPGEGNLDAEMMLVGEQPGDKEDLAGKPFVGPAGRILDRALDDAGIARRKVFVTNAVKHFKYELRGKRRLHKKPNAGEIDICRWWLDLERKLVAPKTIVALGATAARGVFGRSMTISAERGAPHRTAEGTVLFVTIHPSLLLRLQGDAEKAQEYERFVADLRSAAASL